MLFARGHRRVPPRRQRPAADHHAGERAGAVRTARPPRAGGDAARRDVARAVELPPRPRARRSRGPARRPSSARRGRRSSWRPAPTLDLNDAAVYARQQIDAARRDPTPRARAGAPGRPEPTGARGAAPRRRRAHLGRDRRPSCSSRRGPPSTTSRTSTRRSACRTGPRRRAGPSRTGSSTAPSPADAARPSCALTEMGRSTDAADQGVSRQ